MYFGKIRARQLEHSIGSLQSQGYCVERLVEAVEIFFMLMRDNFLLLFPRRPQVRTTFYAFVQLTLIACVSNSQSSCVVVEKWLQCVVLLHDKLFSPSMTMLFIVTNFVLAICHA